MSAPTNMTKKNGNKGRTNESQSESRVEKSCTNERRSTGVRLNWGRIAKKSDGNSDKSNEKSSDRSSNSSFGKDDKCCNESPRGCFCASSQNHMNRYKTEMCRTFEDTGSCSYGAKCQYAHGKEELRSVQRHPKYKTEICEFPLNTTDFSDFSSFFFDFFC
eukprot:TRINITY_DN10695_c0_g1_i1.p1 TRINITY_DN10695_c0_g1~~TRINITY_DN10695_c0_g1_i1.p1  ORF type:complete len:161 (-),score=32.18 TRINITY_DN10695_c0_g1_i1:655-1137(-)